MDSPHSSEIVELENYAQAYELIHENKEKVEIYANTTTL